jgi:DNA polymerase-3 subunit epsilon
MDFVALDVETANPDLSSICQVGMARFQDGKITHEFSTLVDPQDYFDLMNVYVHGIEEDDVIGAPTYAQISSQVNELLDGAICATHTHFDRSAVHQACSRHNTVLPTCKWLDTARVARRTWESVAQRGYGLGNLAEMLGIEFKHHDALEDATAAGRILCLAVEQSGLDLAAWQERIKQPIYGDYREAIKHEGNPEGPLFGEVVVFTGALSMPRREAAQVAADLGCAVVTGVSKKITMLVVGDQDITKLAGNERSSKHRKAEELMSKGFPIRILRETDFLALLDHS